MFERKVISTFWMFLYLFAFKHKTPESLNNLSKRKHVVMVFIKFNFQNITLCKSGNALKHLLDHDILTYIFGPQLLGFFAHCIGQGQNGVGINIHTVIAFKGFMLLEAVGLIFPAMLH